VPLFGLRKILIDHPNILFIDVRIEAFSDFFQFGDGIAQTVRRGIIAVYLIDQVVKLHGSLFGHFFFNLFDLPFRESVPQKNFFPG